jgi:hypothetical protein
LIFGNEFKQAVEKRDIRSVSAIYGFFDNNDLRELFNERFGLYFSDRVKALLSEQCPIEALITELRNAKDFVTAFSPGSPLQEVVRTAFDRGLAQKSEYTSKSLAAYFNKGLPLTDDDIDIFRLHRPKDFFEAAYAYLLTKGILSWAPIDIVGEEKLIQRFKEISSPEYTERLELMVRDVKAAQASKIDSPKFSAMILPRQASGQGSIDNAEFLLDVREQMDMVADSFIGHEFHKQVFWSSALSTVHVLICGIDYVMSGDQALILMALRDGFSTVNEIARLTNLNRESIQDNLVVLQKKEAGQIVVAAGHSFRITDKVAFGGNPPIRFPSVTVALAEREKADVESAIE